MAWPKPFALQPSDSNLVTQMNHLVKKEIILDWQHLTTYSVVSSKPHIDLLCNRRIEKPFTVGTHKLWVVGRVAVLLAKCVCAFMFIQKMPNVDTHPNVCKPRITTRHCLLFGIAIAVVDHVFWLLCPCNRENTFNKNLSLFSILNHEKFTITYQNI